MKKMKTIADFVALYHAKKKIKKSSKRLIPAWKGFFLKDEIQGNRSNSENNWK
jgi:hypothetical protein